MRLKASLDPESKLLSSWTSSDDQCGGSFEGVACNEKGQVANISLQGKGLSGKLSPAVAELRHLTGLYLHYNALYGEIPREISSLSELSDLYLNVNNLSGEIPPELGNLANLQGKYFSSSDASLTCLFFLIGYALHCFLVSVDILLLESELETLKYACAFASSCFLFCFLFSSDKIQLFLKKILDKRDLNCNLSLKVEFMLFTWFGMWLCMLSILVICLVFFIKFQSFLFFVNYIHTSLWEFTVDRISGLMRKVSVFA